MLSTFQVQETIDARDISDKSNSKPLLTTQEIGEMGFDLALFGVTPLQCVVGTLESAAIEFLGTNKDWESDGTGIILSQTTMTDFATVKRVVGFEELEAFESKFPCTSTTTTTSDDADSDNDLVPIFDDDMDEDTEAKPIDTDIINGSQGGYIVRKVYNVPLEGFPKDGIEEDVVSLCSIFSSNDINRLGLNSNNVTLPAALNI